MRKRIIMGLALVSVVALSTAVSASGRIYKWVDEEGTLHFSDRASRAGAERVDLKPIPKGGADGGEKARQFLEQNAERQKACNTVRQRLESYKQASSIMRDTKDGGQEKMSDEERSKLIADTEKEVKEVCGSAP